MKSSIDKHKKQIEKYLDSLPVKTFRFRELGKIREQIKEKYNLASSLGFNKFLNFLIEHSELQRIEFNFPNRNETVFTWRNPTIYDILVNLYPQGYFSHHTAMGLNNLTEQTPQLIYYNVEQPNKSSFRDELKQDNVDKAFQNNPRVSNNFIIFEENKIFLLNGKFTNSLGVIENDSKRVTNIERTLIDIVVRPIYSGGMFEILKAYRNAKNLVSVYKLLSYLKQLDYIYPYHQSIGFYLEKAGYNEEELKMVRELGINFNFYLDYKLVNPEYSSKWGIYYPSGL